jgi:predicted nucleic acid-binding protein
LSNNFLRLVIDTSIAQSAGVSEHPTSKMCREFLEAVLANLYNIVFSPEIEEEWNRHLTRFSSRWRTSMIGANQVIWIDSCTNVDLREKIENASQDKFDKATMLKDCILLEAALITDKIIFSMDEKIRRKFNRIAKIQVKELQQIMWANPTKDQDDCVAWLQKDAEDDDKRKLGKSKD